MREPFAVDPHAGIVALGARGGGRRRAHRRALLDRRRVHRRRGHPDRVVRSRRRRRARGRGVGQHRRHGAGRACRWSTWPRESRDEGVLATRRTRPWRCPRRSKTRWPSIAALAGYAPTPLHDLGEGVWLKDESDRLGLPAFKVLGASWAVERALRDDPSVHTLVAASAGNHGRAVAHVAALRGLRCRVYLPARAVPARREAIAGEGAEVVMVDGDLRGRGRPRRRGRARNRAASSSPTSATPGPRAGSSTATRRCFARARGAARQVRAPAVRRSCRSAWARSAPPRRAGARRSGRR